jgi:hypothetical protein
VKPPKWAEFTLETSLSSTLPVPSASFELTRGFQSLYNTASLVGIGFLVACGGFWYITIRLLPRLRGYHLVDET